MRELYSKACETLAANEEATMIDYWKSVTIRNVIDYVGIAWDNIKQLLSITAGKMFGQTL